MTRKGQKIVRPAYKALYLQECENGRTKDKMLVAKEALILQADTDRDNWKAAWNATGNTVLDLQDRLRLTRGALLLCAMAFLAALVIR